MWRRKWQSTPVLLPGKSHGRRSLVGYSPWGRKESDTTEWLHFTSQECAPTKITVTSHRMMSYCLLNWSSASLKSRFVRMRYCVDIACFNSEWVQGHIQQQRGGRWGCVWHKLERSLCGPGTVTEEPHFVGEGGAMVDAVEWRQTSEEVTSSGGSFFKKTKIRKSN